ncbi:hypothetical protein OIB37_27730 [Streptomyces sp. NBC_00820]|uniref:hypothetical protein n=1 Tax=Streptomyces sp. NBC_00820 TaxID=2975842 RepID=UPI002ED61D1A|nr:hypothetical protein OIB37_27730 [Streptomyces sp. NBC_00820]
MFTSSRCAVSRFTFSRFASSGLASRRPASRRRALAVAGATAALALAVSACGSSGGSSSMPGMDHATGSSASSSSGTSMGDMPGMGHGASGNGGLSDTRDGYRLVSKDRRLPAGTRAAYRFTVIGPDGKPVTGFALDQTERMHFYAVRSDLTGFQHLHPVMAADGTWTAEPASLAPGSWRVFASFTPDAGAGKGKDLVLSRGLTVPGRTAKPAPLPAPATSARADGYTVTVKGELTAGTARPLTVSVSRGGKPVTDLQPYLGTYAHLTAFHEGDLAFAHLHPAAAEVTGDRGGPDLSFHAELPTSGDWRLFLQFRTGGKLHTTAVTLRAG